MIIIMVSYEYMILEQTINYIFVCLISTIILPFLIMSPTLSLLRISVPPSSFHPHHTHFLRPAETLGIPT